MMMDGLRAVVEKPIRVASGTGSARKRGHQEPEAGRRLLGGPVITVPWRRASSDARPDATWRRPLAVEVCPFGGRDLVEGAFRIPGLRKVGLTEPYFHNGGQVTLQQVPRFLPPPRRFRRSQCRRLEPDHDLHGLRRGRRPADGRVPAELDRRAPAPGAGTVRSPAAVRAERQPRRFARADVRHRDRLVRPP
jgi:hypothetical protein